MSEPGFIYKQPTVQIDTLEMYEKTNNAFSVNNYVNIMLAIVIFMFIYIFILCFMWYIERRNLVPELLGRRFKPYKIFTFSLGDSEKIDSRNMITIMLIALLTLLSILCGVYFDIVKNLIIKIYTTVEGIING